MSFECSETSSMGSLHGYVWRPSSEPLRAACVILHGYAAHGRYGTIVFAAELLAAHGVGVVAGDFRGFGKSEGWPGYVESLGQLLSDAEEMVDYASKEAFPGLPLFAVGSSMGGNLALHLSLRRASIKGVVLLGPMIQTSAAPPWWQLPVLQAMSCLPYVRSVGVLRPVGLASDKQYRDPERRRVCDDDPLGYHGAMCLATGAALLEAITELRTRLKELTVPMLIIHGDADEIVPLAGSRLLYDQSSSTDKTLSVYPDMLHSPLCEFPDVRAKVEAEILAWIGARLVSSS